MKSIESFMDRATLFVLGSMAGFVFAVIISMFLGLFPRDYDVLDWLVFTWIIIGTGLWFVDMDKKFNGEPNNLMAQLCLMVWFSLLLLAIVAVISML